MLGGGGGAGAYIINNHLEDLFVGTNPLNTELLWDQMFASSPFYGRRGLRRHGHQRGGSCAVDIAGKHAGKPVYQRVLKKSPKQESRHSRQRSRVYDNSATLLLHNK